MQEQKDCEQKYFSTTIGNLALAASKNGRFPVSEEAVRCGISVFCELGLIEESPYPKSPVATEAQPPTGQGTKARAEDGAILLHVSETKSKVELVDSVRYQEGLTEQTNFDEFKTWIFKCEANLLETQVTHAILPNERSGIIKEAK
jgi:hypothetical protein